MKRRTSVIQASQAVFMVLFAVWALLPSRSSLWIELSDFRISLNDTLLLIGTAIVLFRKSHEEDRVWRKYQRVAPRYFLALLAYALLSVIWSSVSGIDTVAMLWTLITSVCTVLLSFAGVYSADRTIVRQRLQLLTLGLAFISLIYFVECFFSVGLRSAEGAEWTDYGMQRLRGPLYGSSLGQFLLFPALGCSIDSLISTRKHRLGWSAVVFIFCVCIFSLGSRSVVLGIGVMAVVATAKLPRKARRVFITVAPVVILVAGGIVFSRATLDRLISTEDIRRAATYETAINMIRSEDGLSVLFGAGYGSRWPWYMVDVTPGAIEGELYFRDTDYGMSLYHPHSTIFLVVVELGIVGTSLSILALLWLARVLNSNLKCGTAQFLSIGLAASLPICCFDLAFFKAAQDNTIWWMYAGAAAALARPLVRRVQESHSRSLLGSLQPCVSSK